MLRVRLRHLDVLNRARGVVASQYNELLHGVRGVVPPVVDADCLHVFHQYTVRVLGSRRGEVLERLTEEGIGGQIYYPIACHQLPPFTSQEIALPATEQATGEVLSLPMGATLEPAAVKHVTTSLTNALSIVKRTSA